MLTELLLTRQSGDKSATQVITLQQHDSVRRCGLVTTTAAGSAPSAASSRVLDRILAASKTRKDRVDLRIAKSAQLSSDGGDFLPGKVANLPPDIQ